MNTKQLFVPIALIGVCLIGTTPASAAMISFSEDPERQIIKMGTKTMEGGGNAVSDVLELDSYSVTPAIVATAPTTVVGFRATFQSDTETPLAVSAQFDAAEGVVPLLGAFLNALSDAMGGLVPLLGALPLFAISLGALGLLGWRRKRKAA
jgi:hypothetical protein